MTVLVYAWQWRSGPFRVAVWCINLRSDRTMQVIYSVDCVFCTLCTWQLGIEKMNNKIKKKNGNIIPSLPFTSLPSHHTKEYIPSSTQLSSWIPSYIRVIRYLVIKTLSYLYWLTGYLLRTASVQADLLIFTVKFPIDRNYYPQMSGEFVVRSTDRSPGSWILHKWNCSTDTADKEPKVEGREKHSGRFLETVR